MAIFRQIAEEKYGMERAAIFKALEGAGLKDPDSNILPETTTWAAVKAELDKASKNPAPADGPPPPYEGEDDDPRDPVDRLRELTDDLKLTDADLEAASAEVTGRSAVDVQAGQEGAVAAALLKMTPEPES